MKALINIFILTVIYLFQNIVEATTYQFYRLVIGTMKADNIILGLVDYVFRFTVYKFGMTILAFLPLVLLLNAIIKFFFKKIFIRFAIVNLFVNVFIVGFIGFYLEPLMFDKTIFYNTILVSLIFGFLLVLLKPYSNTLLGRGL